MRRYDPIDITELLPLVERPQRYAGAERRASPRPLTDETVAWVLCFPETYEIGMSHLGLKVLYQVLNGQEGIVADRAFAPWPDMEAALRRRGLPLHGIETLAPLALFDIVGFSLQYELTYVNVLTMLDLAGIPLQAVHRDGSHPLVLGGGPNMANPEPLAEFFDAFVIGDGEEVVLQISETVRAQRAKLHAPGADARTELLAALARIPGVYVPRFYGVEYSADGAILGFHPLRDDVPERIERVWVPDLAAVPYPTDPVVPLAEVVQDRYAIEVVRGCTQGCRFCQAGYWYRPVRERPAEQVVELARRGVESGGFDEVSLCSLSTADHSQVVEMTRGVAEAMRASQVSISLPSLRADSFSVGIAEAAGEVKKNGFTFAPESGSERLRRVINKNITDDAMLAAIETAYRSGWSLVKLYFMIGLPTETDDDVASIARLLEKVNAVGRRVGGGKRITASIGAHVPKAFTPFQWEAFDGVERLEQKLALLRRELGRNRFVRLKWHDFEPSRLEAVLALGDRRMAPVIAAAWRRGARFDGWHECFDWSRWEAAFDACGVRPEWFTSGRPVDAVLPWDLIDAAVTRKFLANERRKGIDERLTSDCRWGDCHMCGIPGAPADIRLSVPLAEAPGVGETLGLDGNPVRQAGHARRRTPAAEDAAAANVASSDAAAAPAPPGPLRTMPGPRYGRGRRGAPRAASPPRAPAIIMRVRFRVDGACRFLPHHDLMRAFQRAGRVAGLPLRFSQGFSPHPRMAFGPPLPMAIGGERELCDLDLERPVTDLVERLNRALPQGIVAIDARRLPPGGPSITARVRGADYVAELPAGLVAIHRLRERVDAFVAAAASPYTKSRPGKPDRTIDLKRAVHGLELASNGTGGALLRFGLAVQEADGHETRAQTVLDHVIGLDAEEIARVRVTRQAMRDADGTVL